MKFRTTLVLLVILATVVAFIAFYESKRPGTDEVEDKAADVFDIRTEDVTRLSVITGSTEISLQKGDREWFLLEPVAWRADTSTVDRILSDLEFLRSDGRLSPTDDKKMDLQAYGLDAPEMSISFRERGREHMLTIGSRKGIDGKQYARIDETGEVLLLAPKALAAAKVPQSNFRDKTVLEFGTDKVSRLEIERRIGNLVCELEGDQWYVTEPTRVRASKVQVESLVNQIAALKVKDWIDDSPENLAEYGLSSPEVVARLDVGEDAKPSLLLGGVVPDDPEKRYAKIATADLVFTVRENIAPELQKPYSEIRDRDLVRLNTDRLRAISIVTDSYVISLASAGTLENRHWGLDSPVEIAADSDGVRNYVDRLNRLDIKDFVSDSEDEDLSAYGFSDGRPKLLFEPLDVEGAGEPLEVLIGRRDGDGQMVYVKRSDEPSVYAIESTQLPRILPSYLTFRTKKLLGFSSVNVEKLTLRRDDGEYVCEKESVSKWRLREPFNVSANAANVRTILNNLAGLKAERFISDSPGDWAQYGLSPPALTVTAEFKSDAGEEDADTNPPEPVELAIGSQFDGEPLYFASLKGNPLLFLIPQSLVDKLQADLVERVVVDFLTSEILDLTITYPDENLEILIKKDGTRWRMVEPEESEVEASKLSVVTSALSRLKCVNFVEEIDPKPETLGLDSPVVQIVVNLGSKRITLKLGAQTPDGDYYAEASSTSLPFTVAGEVARSLVKRPSDLRK